MRKYLFPIIALLWSLSAFAQNDKQLTDATLSQNKIEGHIRFLASDELKGRNTPSPEQLIAARYIVTQLKSFGAKALNQYPDYLQLVEMRVQQIPKEVSLFYNNQSFAVKTHTILMNGGNLQSETEGVFLNYGTEKDFENTDVKGKIVFVKAGLEGQTSPQQWFFAGGAKRKLAAQKGAIALVEFYNSPQIPWQLLVGYLHTERMELVDEQGEKNPLSHIWLNDVSGKELAYWTNNKKNKVQIKISGAESKKVSTYNIVAYIEGTDAKLKDEYVVYSAHYDHVGIGNPDAKGDTIYNGARDNAVGTVTVLSAAENIAKYPTKRSALFILFTGEEKGLLGSRWFVEHSPIEAKKMVYCFNSDNAGYNDTSLATIIGLGRTTADVYIKQACEAYGLKATDDPAPEQNLFDRSDNVNFAKIGIPSPTFSLGFKVFDDEINKYYHQASDQADNLDYEYLYKFFGSYVYSCRLIGNATERPFWKTGDKYYQIGMSLYK